MVQEFGLGVPDLLDPHVRVGSGDETKLYYRTCTQSYAGINNAIYNFVDSQ